MTPDETDAWFAAHPHRCDEWTVDAMATPIGERG
jgi:hypothetical protein